MFDFKKKPFQSILLIVFAFTISSAFSDDQVSAPVASPTLQLDTKEEILKSEALRIAEQKKQQSALDNLVSTQEALQAKVTELKELQKKIKNADPTAKVDLQASLDQINAEIKMLNQAFEQVAIGGISLEAFGKEEVFDWQKELVLITQPVLESLKGLTEKPRKVEYFKNIIAERNLQAIKIESAIKTVKGRLASLPPTSIAPGLRSTLTTWENNQKNNLREIELAKVQLENLLGNNVAWHESLSIILKEFFNGRGKTLFFAFIVSVSVWLLMKAMQWLLMYASNHRYFSKSNANKQQPKSTRLRLVFYLYKALTTLLIVLAIMIVFYVRGDLLMLALMIIIFVGIAMAIRKLLPKYISEARVLLNLGTIREDERVIYNGIPWQVMHINVHSILRNPCLQGILRIPLEELTQLNSRPINKNEIWFPTNKGDFLLLPDGNLAEVISQTSENVELQMRGGMRITYPSESFFPLNFANLTSGGSYGCSSVFGVDYQHVGISLTEIPETLKNSVSEGLRIAGLSEHVVDILVDFQSANTSSLDYIIIVTMNSRVASVYFKVGRVIQQSCVSACIENKWGIPFPQLTVHQAS